MLQGFALKVKLAGGVAGVTASSLVVFGGIAMYMAFHALSFGPITWLSGRAAATAALSCGPA